VLGVIDGTSVLIETVPRRPARTRWRPTPSATWSSFRNRRRSPWSVGGDTTDVGAGICGSNTGCVGIFSHSVDRDRDDDDDDDRDDSGEHHPGAGPFSLARGGW